MLLLFVQFVHTLTSKYLAVDITSVSQTEGTNLKASTPASMSWGSAVGPTEPSLGKVQGVEYPFIVSVEHQPLMLCAMLYFQHVKFGTPFMV